MSCAADVCAATGSLRVRVADSGIGLSPEGAAKLFRPFVQAEGQETKRRFGGTGLGLAISRNICRAVRAARVSSFCGAKATAFALSSAPLLRSGALPAPLKTPPLRSASDMRPAAPLPPHCVRAPPTRWEGI